jgi:hypothetical protein
MRYTVSTATLARMMPTASAVHRMTAAHAHLELLRSCSDPCGYSWGRCRSSTTAMLLSSSIDGDGLLGSWSNFLA